MSRRDAGIAAALVLSVSGIGLTVAWLVVLLDRAGGQLERLEARAASLTGALEAEGARSARAEAARAEAERRATRAEASAAAARSELERLRARVAELERPAPPPAPPEPEPEPEPEVVAPVRVEPAPATPHEAPAAVALVASLDVVVARGRGRVQVAEGVVLDLVHVPPGRGSVGLDPAGLPATERAARALLPAAGFASPRVPVVLEEGFLVLAREVTNGQYLGVLAAGGVDLSARRRTPGYLAHLEHRPEGWEDQPVRCVSWAEAVEFCEALGRLLQAPVRLPSEVEWELAAAGLGDAPRRFPWGDGAPALPASPDDRTVDGVADLGLGVHEWCIDPWRARRWSEVEGVLVHRPSAVVRPLPRASDPMACRGGSASTRAALQVECAWRQGRLAGTRGPTLGFRVVVPLGR